MAYTFNPFTGNFDYFKTTFDIFGIILTDSNGAQWRLTVNTDGSLQTSIITSGTPIGLLLALTNAL